MGWSRRKRQPPRTTVDIEERVPLGVPAPDAYARLLDVESVGLCLPGLVPGSLRPDGDGSLRAVLRQTALGVTATWQLLVTMRPSPEARRLEIGLDGREQRLGMHLVGTADVAVVESGARATLSCTGHVSVEGRLAAAGGPIIRKVVEETLRRFVSALGAPGAQSAVNPPSTASA